MRFGFMIIPLFALCLMAPSTVVAEESKTEQTATPKADQKDESKAEPKAEASEAKPPKEDSKESKKPEKTDSKPDDAAPKQSNLKQKKDAAKEVSGESQEPKKPDTTTADKAPSEDKDKAADETTQEDAAKEDEKPIDWVDVESTGILANAKKGAMDKTIWSGQKRSEILALLNILPKEQPLRTALALQRRILISETNAGLIDNDIAPSRGHDLLIRRIDLLMQMGLYDDAWELYTQKAEDPYDASLAHRGLVLMILRGDFATACLEEKVLASRYPDDDFFQTLDKACSYTIGTNDTKPKFENSLILESVYNDPAFVVRANNTRALSDMTPLERALVFSSKKIMYQGSLTPETLDITSPGISVLFYMDQALPEEMRGMVAVNLIKKGMAPYVSALAKDPLIRKAYEIKGVDERWPTLETIVSQPNRSAADIAPFSDLLIEADPKMVPPALIPKILGGFLIAGQELSPAWRSAALAKAQENSKIYIYLQAFQSLTPTKNLDFPKDSLRNALRKLRPEEQQQVLAILDTLDKSRPIAQISLNAYEKDLGLTLNNNYVMPSQSLLFLLDTASTQKQVGITVLAVLNTLAAPPVQLYPGSVSQALNSMLNVGLIEDANAIGAELIVNILNKN